jgi:3-hydroxy-3-methylglutaryl CoA synthase
VKVGIDDVNVWGSTLAVDAAAIVAARGRAPEEVARLELLQRSLPPPFEDPVTLAVNAARPLVEDAERDAFGLLVVATESGVDDAKPLSSYVHRWLGLSERTFHLEVKHACLGATAGLQLATSWVRTHPGQRALVIATDMARRAFDHPAEAVEGAGAVALAVAADPRVLVLDPDAAFAAREVYDVRRPARLLEVSDAELSLAAYLDLLEIAWEGYQEATGAALSAFDWLLFHAPLTGLVRQGHRLLLDGSPEGEWDFERRVRPSLGYCRQLGNVYSGMLYAALAGLVDAAPGLAAGQRVALYSYGSGSGACFFAGDVGPAARETVGRHRIGEHLAARRVVDVATYERVVVAHEQSLSEPDFTPDPAWVPGILDSYGGRLVLEEVRGFWRSYAWR